MYILIFMITVKTRLTAPSNVALTFRDCSKAPVNVHAIFCNVDSQIEFPASCMYKLLVKSRIDPIWEVVWVPSTDWVLFLHDYCRNYVILLTGTTWFDTENWIFKYHGSKISNLQNLRRNCNRYKRDYMLIPSTDVFNEMNTSKLEQILRKKHTKIRL